MSAARRRNRKSHAEGHESLISNEVCGAAGGTRTPDPLITNAVVYHIFRA